jgi:hypothetical protein
MLTHPTASLTDYEVRDLNDTINQLFREKRHWETQIVNLGGANYKRATGTMVDAAGREVPGTRGYKYFGRAVDLPGVRELFQKGGEWRRIARVVSLGDVADEEQHRLRQKSRRARRRSRCSATRGQTTMAIMTRWMPSSQRRRRRSNARVRYLQAPHIQPLANR